MLGISKNDKVPAKRIEIKNNEDVQDGVIDSNS